METEGTDPRSFAPLSLSQLSALFWYFIMCLNLDTIGMSKSRQREQFAFQLKNLHRVNKAGDIPWLCDYVSHHWGVWWLKEEHFEVPTTLGNNWTTTNAKKVIFDQELMVDDIREQKLAQSVEQGTIL